jgi:hypothetical protein
MSESELFKLVREINNYRQIKANLWVKQALKESNE